MASNTDLHIVIADDSEIFREGIKAIINNESGISLEKEVSSGEELKEILTSGYKPDAILIDTCLRYGGDIYELLAKIKTDFPDIKIIVLTYSKEVKNIVKAVYSRISSYLAKDSSIDEIISVIKTIKQGDGVYFGETISEKLLLKGFGNEQNIANGKPYELSSRELDILTKLASGSSVKEIATSSNISITTVESYKERIKNKLGLNTIMEAVVSAVRCELI